MKKAVYVLLSILLIIVFLNFDFNNFILNVKQVPPLAFGGLLFIQIISQLLVNYQWCRIGKIMGRAHDFFRMLYVNARGMIIECVTPGIKIGGEVTRAYLLKSEFDYSAEEAATLVTIQKMVSFSSFFLINLFAFAHISNEMAFLQSTFIKSIVYFFILSLIAILFLFFIYTAWLQDKLENKTPKAKWSIVLHRYMVTLLRNIKVLKNIKGEVLKQFLLSLAIWLLFPIKMVILVSLFTGDYNAIFLTEVTFISYMIGMIPLLPGGIGSFEATMTGLLVIMNIPPSEALAITLLFRFITFWFVILLSLLYAGIWKLGEKRNYEIY